MIATIGHFEGLSKTMKLPIVTIPNKILQRKARIVTKLDKQVIGLIKNMVAILQSQDAEGVGLAAPQIGRNLRIIVVKETSSEAETPQTDQAHQTPTSARFDREARRASPQRDGRSKTDHPTPPKVVSLINPKIIRQSRKRELGWEGCLSIPDQFGQVKRAAEIKITALGIDGKKKTMAAQGFLSRVIQHEIDHLDGILFTDKVEGKIYSGKEIEEAINQCTA